MSRHLAIATCAALLPDGDADDLPLARALARLEVKATVVGWAETGVDWADFDATVIRSTWDYTSRRSEFLAWTEGVPRLFNPAPVVTGNSDKRYLLELAAAGLPVVPTGYFEPGQPVVLPEVGEYVLKPSVGAGSLGAGRFDAGRPEAARQAQQHAASIHAAGRGVLVQPYLSEVDADGETALMFFNGRYSHAVRKSAMLAPQARHSVHAKLGDLYLEERIEPRQPSGAELAVAEAVLAQVNAGTEPLLYARIDLLPTPAGPLLVEAELTEPSLYLTYHPEAEDRFAAAIADRVG